MQKDFSYPIKIDELGQGEQCYKLSVDKEEREVLADILQVPAVNSFSSEIHVKMHNRTGMLDVWGNVKANLRLMSVISLNEFDKEYSTDFKLLYDTKATYEQIREIDESINDDVPDVIIGGKIDLWDIAIEHLALIMEDHPRQEGESFSSVIENKEEQGNNPFAVLSKLKK